MIKMKQIARSICAVFLFLSITALGQAPTMTFDGKSLQVVVPSGHLELEKSAIENDAIRDCIEWGGRETCVFMSSPEPYYLKPFGLKDDEPVYLPGLFNEEPIMIQVEMKPHEQPVQPDPEPAKKSSILNVLVIVGIALLLLLIGLFFIFRKRNKGRAFKPKEQKGPDVLSMITDESVVYERGLEHVRKRENEYLTFDMDQVFEDTAVKKVYFNTDLIKKLYDFFNGSLEDGGRTNETGCFILGCWDLVQGRKDRYDVSLEYMVEPGDDADFGEYSLNFGKKIGINMASVIDTLGQKSKRDYVLTCWMHSHPGLGLFLSNQDLIVQQQLTYSDHRKRLLALVIDTNTPDFKLGFFTAKTDGKMNNQEEVRQWFSFEEIYRQSREMNRNSGPKTNLLEEFKADPDCYTMELNDESLHHIGFAPHAINQIDNALYSNSKGVAGYLYGDETGNYVQIGCCLPYENEEKVACLINDSDLDAASLAKYAGETEGCRFLVQCVADDQLRVWTRNEQGGMSPTGSTTLTQMKEWIRRKRV